MRKFLFYICSLFIIIMPFSVHAILSMELTRGVAGAIPIAIVPFTDSASPQDISQVISQDLQNSGRFKVYYRKLISVIPHAAESVSTDYFQRLGTNNVVVGQVQQLASGQYQVKFQLLDIFRGKDASSIVLSKQFTIPHNESRRVAHHISDLIYQQITGTRGIFSTKIAYVVVQRSGAGKAKYLLEVSDQDGYNPRPLLTSLEPIMSPAWSPNGKQIAYVSFEKRKASIYVHDVVTGSRRLLSDFPGINGAPAWSPDGTKLALVLSKSGAPNIYIQDVNNGSLKAVTSDFYINTEPSWSPDGRSLIFTSNKSGGPQIYQYQVGSGTISRLTFDGPYNARASYAQDGKYITMIHRISGIYNIAMLDLDTGRMNVLNKASGDSASPSFAPNGSMILYDTVYGGRNVLAMVSSDGRIQLRLPARNGEAQDPAWSPFLS